MKVSSVMDVLFKPRSVAVIGASADASKTSGRPIAYLQQHGFAGAIYPVNPRVSEINSLTCYPSIASLPAVPDVAMVLLGAERAEGAVRELAALGVKACIVLASGYAETGEAGAARQAALLAAARRVDSGLPPMRLLGPNTIGLVNLTDSIVLSPSGALDMQALSHGSISVVSQSGGILGSLLSRASARGVGLSKLISTSNEVDIDLADCVDYLADDPDTEVIVLYIETVRNVARFKAACLKARQANGGLGKPIVAVKIGRSEAGAQAAVSHTGAMAGSDRMYDALFASCGVIRAQVFSDLLDIPLALCTGKKLNGKRVAILTSTGGAGTLVSDSLGLAGFEAPAPDADTALKLRATQTGDHAVFDKNPIDVTLAGLQPAVLRGAVAALLASASYDALIVIVGSSGVAQPNLMADAIAGALKDAPAFAHKPVLAYVSPHSPEAAAVLSSLGVPAFTAPESCAQALLGMQQQAQYQHKQQHQQHASRSAETAPLASFSSQLKGSLNEFEAKQIFAQFGVPATRETVVASSVEATKAAQAMASSGSQKFVLKILSNSITHKSDMDGVAVNLTQDQVGARLDQMRADVQAHAGVVCDQFLLQEMVAGGVEMILGMNRDPIGSAILLGMGGTAAELMEDTALRMCPVDRAGARNMMESLKTWPLLNGYRGRPFADVDALLDAVVAFSNMVEALGDRLLEAEINPLFVLPKGQGARAADAVMVLAD